MGQFFTRERFGRPQFVAALLLVMFLAQGAWLVSRRARVRQVGGGEMYRLVEGLSQWRGATVAGTAYGSRDSELEDFAPVEVTSNSGYDPNHSPLWYLIASAPLLLWRAPLTVQSFPQWTWFAQAPSLALGVLLGASLWYVARRLYGNAGGYIALALYCFSPVILRVCTLWNAEPEIGAAWGAFGAIFTAIAVAHTLYAPREVVLWNWRRILLLGLSLALAVGSQFSLVVVVPVTLFLMLYLAPARRLAGLAIWMTACVFGLLLLLAGYSFHPGVFWQGMRHAEFFPVSWRAFGMTVAYRRLASQLVESSPALLVALPISVITFAVWPRARYFGNTSPLALAALFLLLALGSPHYPGLGFQIVALPFLFVFTAGVIADLLESRHRNLARACILGLLSASAIWNVVELARI